MKNLKYCHACGRELTPKALKDGSIEKFCSKCNQVFFDSPYPAVIVAVTFSGRVLLTDKGLVAGHIKSGETAEETAIREIREEVGLEVSGLRFVGTYASKERDLLMIGFTAESKDDRIIKSDELERAAWFRVNDYLPLRPNSIAAQVVKQLFPRATFLEPKTAEQH